LSSEGNSTWGLHSSDPCAGRRVIEALARVVEDRSRVWLESRVLVAMEELIETFRRCLEVVIGGRERSFLMGSLSVVEPALERLPERDLCRPPVVGLLMLTREGGGRKEALLVMLAELDGRAVVVLRGFTGSRLGD